MTAYRDCSIRSRSGAGRAGELRGEQHATNQSEWRSAVENATLDQAQL